MPRMQIHIRDVERVLLLEREKKQARVPLNHLAISLAA